jgi:serine/threonine protein kinase
MRETHISHYRLLEKLGEGAMGEVFRAEDTRLKRTVALKFLPAAMVADASLRQRFFHEAQAAAALDHPGICTIHEIDERDGDVFLVMAFVDGPTLQKKIEQRPLKLEEALEIAIQAAEGLQAAHECGIVHRDIKSSNILLTSKGQVKITDFGLAMLGGRTRLTEAGAIMGTPAYMSPEQAGGREADARSDLWSLGVVLYEMVAGRLPFGGDNVAAVIYSILYREPEPLTALRTGTPMELDRIVAKALAKDPAERYQHASDLQVDLRAVRRLLEARSQTVSARPAEQAPAVTRLIVLPFRVLRKDEETDFLAYSLPDAISNSLTGVDRLIVRSSLVAARFEGQAPDPRTIAAEAGVDAILAGSLMRAGGQLRLSCQLLAAPSGTLRWSDTVDVSMNDLFALQDGLVHHVVQSLMLPLTERECRALRHDVPASASAYEYYLRANQISAHRSMENVRLARDLYLQCLREDPGYAPAWARLGRVHRFMEKFGYEAEENLKLADEEFRRAFSLNPDLALAHNYYTSIECDQGHALEAMLRLLGRAHIRRHDPDLLAGLVQSCRYCGELDASIAAHDSARRLDPHVTTSLEHTCFALGDYQKTLDLYDNKGGYYLDAAALAALGRNEEALVLLRRRKDAGNPPGVLRGIMRSLLAYLEGDFAECRKGVEEELVRTWADPESVFYSARHLARINETERAIAILSNAIDAGFLCASALAKDPWLESVRNSPGFGELTQKVESRRRQVHAAYLQAGGAEILGVG